MQSKKKKEGDKKFGYYFVLVLQISGLFFFSVLIISIQPLDRQPYKEAEFYKETIKRIDRLALAKSNKKDQRSDYIKAGWAKVNITPKKPVPLAGFFERQGNYYSISDSIFVRAFVFTNGVDKIALVTMDLFMVPPAVSMQLKKYLPASFDTRQVYMGATNTHSSIGGWGEKYFGRNLTGNYAPEIVDLIARSVGQAIFDAEQKLEPVQIGFAKYDAKSLIYNGLVGDKGLVDPWLRVLKIQNRSGKIALITSFSAQPSCMPADNMSVNGDYPSKLVNNLEQDTKIDFAAFFAGAVGSQLPVQLESGNHLKQLVYIASSLSNTIQKNLDSIVVHPSEILEMKQVKISMRAPQVRFSQNWCLRPWLFNWLYGEANPYIEAFRIGNIILVSTPCEFSGELVRGFDNDMMAKGADLMLTSFNGGYVGIVTRDIWYNLPKRETMNMNWYGPQNGDYFSDIVERLIKIM